MFVIVLLLFQINKLTYGVQKKSKLIRKSYNCYLFDFATIPVLVENQKLIAKSVWYTEQSTQLEHIISLLLIGIGKKKMSNDLKGKTLSGLCYHL